VKRTPFVGPPAALLPQHITKPPTPPSKLRPELKLPKEVDGVVLKALAKSPADRWHSARELAEALHEAFGGRPQRTRHGGVAREGPTAPGAVPGTTPPPTVAPAGLAALKRGLATRAKTGDDTVPPLRPLGEPSRPMLPAARPADASRPGDASRPSDALRPADASRPGDGSRPGGGPKARMLFVDDEARILSALKATFRDKYDIETAMSGDAALELLKRRPFHVVVSDQRMPGMQGVELLRRVRETTPKTVRLLLTGYSDLASIVGSINEGEVYRFVSKPWDNDDLAATLREAVAVSIGLAKAAAVPASFKVSADRAVLVFDDDDRIHRAVRELMGGACRVLHARTLEETVKTLAAEEVSVLVADLDIAREEVGILFRLLKQEHPQTLAIAVTRASDSELVIDLINQARLFRFVAKPINLASLKAHIIAALERYESFRAAPELVATQQAAPTPGMGESTAAAKIVGRLRSLGSRFAAALKPG
jgi:serine/threonine-protein kinase